MRWGTKSRLGTALLSDVHDMIAIRYHEFGHPAEALKVEDVDVPHPAAGEVLLRMVGRAINPSDLIPVRGAYKARISLPQTAGYDGFGVVVEGTQALKAGTRVVPMAHLGTWQEYVAVAEAECVPVPDEIPDDYASQLFINPVSVWLMVRALGLAPGAVVVANAGGSAAVRFLAQLTGVCQFRLIAIVRRAHHTEELLRLGAHAVIDSSRQPVAQTVIALTAGAGADAGLECVGGRDAVELARGLRSGAPVVQYGLLSGVSPDLAAIDSLGIRVEGFWLRNWLRSAPASVRTTAAAAVFQIIAEHRFRLDVHETFALQDVHRAVRKAETPGLCGKVLLKS
ncbi:alcohol dehydrogenase [Gemmata obscuriglobus]|uniref:Alcohol dehydrogenase n=2 Tax=Gemmata obscuriglobus TaxID=114 RepID=A0A2Z3HBW7_9BACT|nr:alcohol dehydrogenase [Gemmata obscuriglobus]